MAVSSTYPLLPYSQLVYDMLKSNPDVYWTCTTMRLDKKKVDVERLKWAVEEAIRNHPVFFMRVDESGKQQYEPQLDVLHTQYCSVDFEDKGECVDVQIRMNRILGDWRSDAILIEDVARAYSRLPLERDDYLNYLQRVEQEKQSPRYEQNRQWLETEFGQLSCPVHPKTDLPIDIAEMPIEGMFMEDYTPIRPALNRLAADQLISVGAFFSLASALAIMEYNGCDEAALTWAYEGRECPEEQRVFGSLHRDIPFQIKNLKSKITSHKSDLIKLARNQIRSGIAHSNYPFTLTYPHTRIWNYALNVLEQPSMQEMMRDVPFPFEVIEQQDVPPIAYSLLDVEIYNEQQLSVNYRYSATHYKPESIQKFAALVRKYAEWLLTDQ